MRNSPLRQNLPNLFYINMIYSIKNKHELEDFDELEDLQLKIKEVRLVEKVVKQDFLYDVKKLFEPIFNSIKNFSEDVTKTLMESSTENNNELRFLNKKFLEVMNDRGITAPYLLSPLYKITKPENTNQFKLVKDSNSNRVNDLLIHNKKTVTLYDNLLTFRNTNQENELKGDLLKRITNKITNVDLANLQDKK